MVELKNAVLEATSVIIALPKNAIDKDYLAALQLQKIAPEKTHIVAPEEKESLWLDTFGIPPQRKEFAIVIDTARSPVDELRYEKADGKLTIFLAHTRAFDESSLHFEEYLPASDLIITVGFSSQDEAERFIESFPRKGTARHIWLPERQIEKLTPSSANLLGRIMARSREDDTFGILWSFITKDDFLKTRSLPEHIPSLIETYSAIAASPRAVVVLWQAPEHDLTDGIIWSRDGALLQALTEELGGVFKHDGYIPLPRFANFVEAETEIRKLLHAAHLG